MELSIPEKPCLVDTGRGFSVSYQNRFLYSKYAPERAIEGAINELSILPGTLILAASPLLWLGLDSLVKKLPDNCFILGIECDKNLHEFAAESLAKTEKDSRTALLPFEENGYIVNILSGLRHTNFTLPHISTFRRAILLEMSGGTQFFKDEYKKIAALAENTIASFWKNRLTLTKLGRLYSRNLFKNIGQLPSSRDFSEYKQTVTRPVFVFGAGESIEETLRSVPKSLIEKCFIIAVDAASPSLKAHNIRIDAVVAVEGQLAIEKAYIGGNAKNTLIIADITSRVQVTRHTEKAVTYVASNFTDALFLQNLSQKSFFPPLIPPLGSVGLTAVHIASLLRENINVPVFISGLDFSFSVGRTHAKNTPAHIARLSNMNRLNPQENYEASFRTGAKQITGKNGIAVVTDQALSGYAESFRDIFTNTPNLYDCGKQGIELGIRELSSEKLSAYLATLDISEPIEFEKNALREETCRKISEYLESEEKALNRIKELLVFGKDVASCSCSLEDELHALISPREYLFLHFPDGYKCNTKDLSFLKRVRSQIDFFLKDIRNVLSILPSL